MASHREVTETCCRMLNFSFLFFFACFVANAVTKAVLRITTGIEEWRKIPVLQIINPLHYPLAVFLSPCRKMSLFARKARLPCAREPRQSLEIRFLPVDRRVESSSSSDIRRYKSESQYVSVLLSATFRCHDRGESISIRY